MEKGARCRAPFAFNACSRVNLFGLVLGRVRRRILDRRGFVLAFVLDARGLVLGFVLDRRRLILGAVHDVCGLVLAGCADVLGLVIGIGFHGGRLVLRGTLLVARRE